MVGTRFGDRLRASGGSGATLGGRALRWRRDALDAKEGRSLAPPALHRTQRRLAEVCSLVPRQNPPPPQPRPTYQSVDQSTINPSGGSLKTCWENSCTHSESFRELRNR